MVNKSRQIALAEQNQVDRLLREGMEDKAIMRELNMTTSVYYRCKKKIYKKEAEIFKKQTVEDIAYKSSTLRMRLVDLYKLAVRKLNSSADLSKGEYNPSKDFASTLKVAEEIAINIFQLDTQGIQVARAGLNTSDRSIQRLEDQEDKLLPAIPEFRPESTG